MKLYLEVKLPAGLFSYIKGHQIGADGSKRSPIYQSWYNMIARCYYKGNYSHRYKDRGVRVDTRWILGEGNLSGFECFILDMGDRPPERTLDRIDSNGHYTKRNCRWADISTQNANRKWSKHVIQDKPDL